MKPLFTSLVLGLTLLSSPAFAVDEITSMFKQDGVESITDKTEGFTEQQAEETPEEENEFYIFNQREPMEEKQIAVFQSLDKITGRTERFEAKVGETVKFGAVYVLPRACQKAPPIEPPESAAFIQIWEIDPDDGPTWLFSNWMYASSPAISALDHPVYDIWVVDCRNDESKISSEEKKELAPAEPTKEIPDEVIPKEDVPTEETGHPTEAPVDPSAPITGELPAIGAPTEAAPVEEAIPED